MKLLKFVKRITWKKIKRFIVIAIIVFFGGSIVSTVVYRFVRPPFTPLMIIRLPQQIINGDKVRLKKDWEPLSDISPNMVLAVVAAEDQLYSQHSGFDYEAMKKAYKNNKKGKRIKGASTISQQTAKNVFCWPGRSYLRKGMEAYFTFLIEIVWGKRRIMEMYLNVVEFGNGIYGVEAASKYYYRKRAKNLSVQEAASLAAIMPNPRKWSPVKQGPYIRKRTAWIVRNMYNIGKVKY
jgi:monofunctional biosynthetic peptidoglycan transglycosylase